MENQQKPTLQGLPLEIRHQIFEELSAEEHSVTIWICAEKLQATYGMFQPLRISCRQFKEEINAWADRKTDSERHELCDPFNPRTTKITPRLQFVPNNPLWVSTEFQKRLICATIFGKKRNFLHHPMSAWSTLLDKEAHLAQYLQDIFMK